MNALTAQADLVDFPMHELDQIESAILASQKYLKALEERREALTHELERVTRPRAPSARTTAIEVRQGYFYRGDLARRTTCIDIYLDALRRLWTDFPEKREDIARAICARGRTRAYIARNAAELFPGRTLDWVELHSRLLVEGWYVDTNLSRNQMSQLLPVAVTAAGLKWGEDVKTYWYSGELRIERVGAPKRGGGTAEQSAGLGL